ncbi:MAG: molybdopterin-containing oxidoreductase family protein [Pseudomonadota bacterium]
MSTPNIDAPLKVVHVTCPHDCPDSCSMLVTVDISTGKAIRVEGNPRHPVTRGFLCNKVNSYLDFVYNDRRMLYPHRRVGPKGPGARFERIGWEEAIGTITDRFKRVIDEQGPEAVQPFSFSGTLGILGFLGMGERFFNRMGAARLERTICTAAGKFANMVTTGGWSDANIEDIPAMDVVVLWATNPVSTSVHMMPFVEQARRNGAKIIAIDPRVTRTTEWASWHLQPRPGTDSALALGMMKVIVDHGLHDERFLREHTVGWERLIEERLPWYSLERVAAITGIPARDIERFALLYGGTRKSFIRLNWGIQRHDNGGMMTRCVLVLPAITGAWQTGGGACLGTGDAMRGVDFRKLQRPDLLSGRTPRAINMIRIGEALNDRSLDPPIKALYCWNADPANCVPDTASARKGLMRDDLFVVVHDTFFSDTCDYADILLPADTQLEHMDLHGAYGNYVFSLSVPAIEKIGESLDNQEVFRRLAKSMGYDDPCLYESDEEMIRELIDPDFNPLFEGISLEGLKQTGWARAAVGSPRRPGVNSGQWKTPSGKIEIFSAALEAMGLDPLPDHVPEREGLAAAEQSRFPLQVISAATHYYIGNSFQPVPRLRKLASRPEFEISPEDAAERNISDGDLCRLFNDQGETFGYAVVVPGLLKGVLGAPKQIAGSRTPGGLNVNALVSQRVADMGGAPVYYSTMAEIQRAVPPGSSLTEGAGDGISDQPRAI